MSGTQRLPEPMVVEFVGGPEDGRRVVVSEGVHVLSVPRMVPFRKMGDIADLMGSPVPRFHVETWEVETWEVVGINDDGSRRLMRTR